MITGFEQETAPLNEVELYAAKIIDCCLKRGHIGQEHAVTADHIGKSLAAQNMAFRDAKGRPYLTGARIRKIVNYLRTSRICPRLIASAKGYYISNNPEELTEYITSLRQRASAIQAVADAMSAAL